MAIINRQPSYAQGINLSGACIHYAYILLRFVKQYQSEILHPEM